MVENKTSKEEIIKIIDIFKIHIKSPVILLDNCCGFKFSGDFAQHNDLRIVFGNSKGTHSVSSDELKESMFCWVYDTRNETDVNKRRVFLFEKMKSKYPDFNFLVAATVGSTKFSWAEINCHGSCVFDDYGGYILMVLY